MFGNYSIINNDNAAFNIFVKVKLNIFEDILLRICLGVVKENKIIKFSI